MPDCTELQNAVNASVAIIDGLLTQLDGELILLNQRIMLLDECMMGGYMAVGGEALQGLTLHSQNVTAALTQTIGDLLNDSGEHPAVDDGGSGAAP